MTKRIEQNLGQKDRKNGKSGHEKLQDEGGYVNHAVSRQGELEGVQEAFHGSKYNGERDSRKENAYMRCEYIVQRA